MSFSSDEDLPEIKFGGPSRSQSAASGPSKAAKPKPSGSQRAQLSKSIDEMSEKELRIELKRREVMDKQRTAEIRKLERERERAENQLQKEIEKAQKQADRSSRKEDQLNERIKLMVVVLDAAIAENSTLMSSLASKLSEAEVEYRISIEGLHPGTIMWKRKTTERTVDQQAQILATTSEEEQSEILVDIDAQGFAGLVHYTKLVNSGQNLSAGAKTFKQFVEQLQADYPGKRVTLVVQGLEAFLRGNKTHQNRQYRQAVTGKPAATKAPPRIFTDVSRLDCEEVLVDMQLHLGCVVTMCEDGEELAEYVYTMTKAISESHYRQQNHFSFHAESGQGPSKQALYDAESKVSLIFKHQLMQFNNVSEHMAAAVVSVYPSPAHLLNAYARCADVKSAQLLLQDIEVRRGVGVVSSTRRLGPTHSKRIHLLMTATDQSLTLE